jgi:hypothetical protein
MTNNEINQTALQEFWDKISLKLSFEQIDEFVPLFYQAKEMEKEQHENTWDDSFLFKDDWEMTFEHYYTETFGGANEN